MRNRIFLIILIIILIMFCFWEIKYIKSSSNNIIKSINNLENSIEDDNYDLGLVKNLDEQWQQTEDIWDLLLEKSSFNEITLAISKIDEYVKFENKEKIMTECNFIKETISVIVEDNKIKLKNIL